MDLSPKFCSVKGCGLLYCKKNNISAFTLFAFILLLSQVHESGIGVQEEGMPAAQRVLISDVPEQAVFSLLQYLYTAKCSIPASLRPHVLELASRLVPSISSVKDVLQFKDLG